MNIVSKVIYLIVIETVYISQFLISNHIYNAFAIPT